MFRNFSVDTSNAYIYLFQLLRDKDPFPSHNHIYIYVCCMLNAVIKEITLSIHM